jgi:Zn-finger nucleic acid-binding protein
MSGVPANPVCSRCQQVLESRRLWDVRVDVCAACKFVALDRVDLPPLLEHLSAERERRLDPDAHLQALPDRTSGAACPLCRQPMEKADYCLAKLAFFERCESCGLVWVGNDELAGMSSMWARMETRSARRQAQIGDDLALMDLLWFAHVSDGYY